MLNEKNTVNPISLRIPAELLKIVNEEIALLNIDRSKFLLKCILNYFASNTAEKFSGLRERIGILRIAILYGEHDEDNLNFVKSEVERVWQLLNGLNTKTQLQKD